MGSSRRAHHMLSSGLPSGGSGLPLLPSLSNKCQSTPNKGEGATSMDEGAATSRGRHLSKRGAPP
jgi:hypothetical protein